MQAGKLFKGSCLPKPSLESFTRHSHSQLWSQVGTDNLFCREQDLGNQGLWKFKICSQTMKSTVFAISEDMGQWHKFNQCTGSAILWGSAFGASNTSGSGFTQEHRCGQMPFLSETTEEPGALSASVVPTWLLLVNESLTLIKLVLSFRGFDLSELYTELLCNSPYISVITICSPFLNTDMCYCLSTMCHQFTTTNSFKWKSGQGEIYFRHFCSTSFYSSPHANHMNFEQGSKKNPNKITFLASDWHFQWIVSFTFWKTSSYTWLPWKT